MPSNTQNRKVALKILKFNTFKLDGGARSHTLTVNRKCSKSQANAFHSLFSSFRMVFGYCIAIVVRSVKASIVHGRRCLFFLLLSLFFLLFSLFFVLPSNGTQVKGNRKHFFEQCKHDNHFT